MLSSERHNYILKKIRSDGAVYTQDLIQALDVSKETVRRDLNILEQRGQLKKVYGGAILTATDNSVTPFTKRIQNQPQEKREIAEFASRIVRKDMSIALDVSTTNLAIVKELKKHFESLTIVTNSLAIALELVDMHSFRVILTGGVLHHDEMSTTGNISREVMNQLNVDLYFMSCDGFSIHSGVTDFGEGEVAMKQVMMHAAAKVVLVCPSTRFDVSSLLHVCDCQQLDAVITDRALPDHIRRKYTENGIRILDGTTEL